MRSGHNQNKAEVFDFMEVVALLLNDPFWREASIDGEIPLLNTYIRPWIGPRK
jgi:hypothetical protein